MKKTKVIEVRFAESVKLSQNNEVTYLDLKNETTARKFEIYLDEIGMLWVYDKISKTWTGTSTSNLRSLVIDGNPFGESNENKSKRTPTRIDEKISIGEATT